MSGTFVQLLEQLGPLGGVAVVKRVRDVVAFQGVPELERDRIPAVADDPDQREPRRIEPGPGHQRLAHHRVQQVLAGPPRLGQVVLDVTKCHPPRDDLQHPLVTVVDQQDPLGVRVRGPAARQQLRARHGPHGLIADDQRDLVACIAQRAQPLERRLRRRSRP